MLRLRSWAFRFSLLAAVVVAASGGELGLKW